MYEDSNLPEALTVVAIGFISVGITLSWSIFMNDFPKILRLLLFIVGILFIICGILIMKIANKLVGKRIGADIREG